MSILKKPAYVLSSFELLKAANIPGINPSGYAIYAKKGFAYYQSASEKQPRQTLHSIDTLPLDTHTLEIEGSFIQKSSNLDLNNFLKLILAGSACQISKSIEIEPMYCALI